MTHKQPLLSDTTPLILRLLREERDRIERRLEQFNTTRSHGYQPMHWFDDESHLAGERLRLAECNAAVARHCLRSRK